MNGQLEDITHTIQLAVAPVFLLSGIGTALSVFANRLGRVVDRARQLESAPARDDQHRLEIADELKRLDGRARLILFALTLGTTAALLVCVLIALAFVGYLLSVNLGTVVAITFILAMAAFVGSLVFFLREVFLAIAMLRFTLPPATARTATPPGQDPAAP